MGVPSRQWRVGRITKRAMKLDRSVDDFMHHVREEDFRDAVFLADIEAILRLVGDVHQHKPRDVELARTFRQHELDALALFQTFAEG